MRSRTTSIPIVLSQSNDPVAAGLAKTLARPGRNVTAIAALTEAMAVKQVELLGELLPHMKTVAVLLDPDVFMADNALRLRLPCTGVSRASAEAGFLLTYGASLHGMFSQAASHAARILKGANPAELPIEQPSKFELTLNLKTAEALGLEIPHSVLLRADRLIE